MKPLRPTTWKATTAALIALGAIAVGATAGSLTPPGAVGSTMHSLANIFDSIASSGYDSSAVVANQNGSLMGNLKYIENQMAWASSSGNVWNLNSGNVGIGTTTPASLLTVGRNYRSGGYTNGVNPSRLQVVDTNTGSPFSAVAIFQSIWDYPAGGGGNGGVIIANQTASSSAQNMSGTLIGLTAPAEHLGTGSVTGLRGVFGFAQNRSTGSVATGVGVMGQFGSFGAGSYTNAYGVYGGPSSILAGTISNGYDLYAGRAVLGGGTLTNNAGVAIEHLDQATNNTALLIASSSSNLNIPAGNFGIWNGSPYNNYFAGNVGIGTMSPTTQLEVVGVASISGNLYASASWFRWGTDTAPASAIKLGVLSNAQSVPLYEIIAFDNAGASASLDIHGNRWAENLYFTRAGPTGDRTAMRLFNYDDGFGAVSASLDIYDTSNAKKVRLNALGSSYFMGGNVGVGTITPITQIHVPGLTQPVIKSTTSIPNSAKQVYVQGRYAYVVSISAPTSLLQVFDITNPGAPAMMASVSVGSSAYSISVQGQYAYIVNAGDNTLQIMNVSNPRRPTTVSTTATGTQPKAVVVQGRYAYVTSQTSNLLQIFDVANPAAPVVVGSVGIGTGTTFGLAVQGRYVYVANSTAQTFQIIDVINPAAPVVVRTVATAGAAPQGLAVEGRYAYVAETTGQVVEVFDVAHAASASSVTTISTGASSGPQSVYVQDRVLYVVTNTSNTMKMFDISNPASPVSFSSISVTTGPWNIYIQGRYAYIGSTQGKTFQIIDVGGAYIQQLETGGLDTSTLSVRGNSQMFNNMDIGGGLIIGRGLQVTGPVSFTSSVSGYNTLAFDATGNVGIGTTNIDAKLEINGTASVSGNVYFGGRVGIGDANPAIQLTIASTSYDGFIMRLQDFDGTCDHNPEAGSETVTCSSDARLKSDISDAPSSLEYLAGFHIRQYTVNASGDRMVGVIAQELLATHPDMVSSGSNGFLSVQQPSIWRLVKAIQEQQAMIDALRAGATTTEPIPLLADDTSFFDRILRLFKDMLGIEFGQGSVKVKQLCVGSVCVNEEQFMQVFGNGVATPTPLPDAVEPTQEATPTPNVETTDSPTPLPTPTPSTEPTATESPAPTETP